MKLSFVFSILLTLFYQGCFSQDKLSSEDWKSTFLEEQEEFGKPVWQYLNTHFTALHSLEETKFADVIDSLKNIYLIHLAKYKGKLDRETYQDEYWGISTAFDKYLLEYPQHHKYITGEEVELSTDNQKLLEEYFEKFNQPVFLKNRDFRSYVKAFISIKSNEKLNRGTYIGWDNQQLIADWAIIDSLFSNQRVNCFWKNEYLNSHIENFGIKNIGPLYKEFLSSCGELEDTSKVCANYNAHLKRRGGHLTEIYKQVGTYNLEMHVFLPDQEDFEGLRPTIAYFHGGSWSEGKPDWFFETGKEYAKKGWVAVAVEYRIKGRHGNYPFESVKDAKTAIRWLRKNSDQYRIDANKIVATGNSAGGHLAIATALVENWNEESDDIAIDAKPNVVIVNSAVYDLTVENSKWIVENQPNKSIVKEISPNSLVKPSSTKFLLIHGENDRRCTFSSAEFFFEKMKTVGNNIELYKIKDANHFIWFGKNAQEVYQITQGYLKKLEWE